MVRKDKKTILYSGILMFILVAFDQFTKYLVVNGLKGKTAIPIIKDVFELKYLENTSAAFGIDPISLLQRLFKFRIFIDNPDLYLNVRMCFFYIFTVVIIVIFCWIFIKIPKHNKMIYLDYIIIFMISGAIGNFIDRISQKYVVDFLYFKLIDFPIFNVADIYVTCAAISMIILGVFYYKDEDFEMIFPSLKNKEEEKIESK